MHWENSVAVVIYFKVSAHIYRHTVHQNARQRYATCKGLPIGELGPRNKQEWSF
jgi:hypothetical protein